MYILERVLHLHEFMNCLTTKCRNKIVGLIDLLWQRNVPAANLFEQESMLNSIELSLTTQHKNNMTRNCSGHDLKVDPIKKDENCFFKATARQLQKHLVQGLELLSCQNISSLGLGINEERDTENLRFLFICEVTENIDEYNQRLTC